MSHTHPHNTHRHTRSNAPLVGNGRGLRAQGSTRAKRPIRRQPAVGAAAAVKLAVSTHSAEGSPTSTGSTSFEHDFGKIQLAAAHLVTIQESAKRKGYFSAEDNKIYAESLLELGKAAQKLALLQQSGQIKDFGVLLEPVALMPEKESAPPLSLGDSAMRPMGDEGLSGDQKVEEATEQQQQQFGPDDFLPPNNEDPYEDSIAVTAPKKDASVAEAKPVGLSIAGEGGVASAKPNAVALSGRNGLAVASPKATAIAGVTPEEAAAFSISLPNNNQLIIKTVGALNRQTSLEQLALYDDYDYADLLPTVSKRRTTMPHAAQSHGQAKPTADPFIAKWKTVIAEDFADSSPSGHGVLLKKQKPHPKPAQAFLLPTRNVFAA